MTVDHKQTCLVFAGGLGLGAYHGGVFEAFVARGWSPDWVTGASAGAITAALIAGSEPQARVDSLRSYWQARTGNQIWIGDPNRHLSAWLSSIGTRLFGNSGFFHPRLPTAGPRFTAFYDLAPTRERLRSLIDFGRLNAGEPRVAIVATDLASGDPVIFDSSTERIEMDHILASCGLIPEFAPVCIGGRWLGDGGLSLNAPFEPVLDSERPLRLIIVDPFARDGDVPDGLEAAVERKNDLMFGNQTFQRLRHALDARRLRAQLQGRGAADEILLLSYRPGPEEAGPEKTFDLSRTAMAQRWRAGHLDLQQAEEAATTRDGIQLVRRLPAPGPAAMRAMAPS
ncbi:putative Patatin [Bradyrhizobium sp. ORS 375]|uniref:patatin-like phospholipase family protein n=1 Tax=Bradyrhizobium sp. (strain ORS 375) TaxID=566679 RepID=UPI0002406894|nr:patatin-like phospholipase family protein [Bradyrhizobium sp. ORS 375]CCD90716.1 putative Patatin [Bradyrhizobium sp. ORS 375]